MSGASTTTALLPDVALDAALGRALAARGTEPEAERVAAAVVERVRVGGDEELARVAVELGDLVPGEPLVLGRDALEDALRSVDREVRELLERTAARVARFARAQREALSDFELELGYGRAGQRYVPLSSAGCYAPGGRHPLPSSVLMTAVPARVAGVGRVVVASPRPGPVTLAAAALAGADQVLRVGGAQAIAALALGTESVPRTDAVVGPGNRYVTAAKKLLAGEVAIDMLAGPSELVVVADATADPATVALDLVAQAEHDPDARPILVALVDGLARRVRSELERVLVDLDTAPTARAALVGGFACTLTEAADAARLVDALAPEHLQVVTADPASFAARVSRYGGLFLGELGAEVLGDYGAGPNHTLPTGGTARFRGPLGVQTFLVARTWLAGRSGPELADLARDAAALARLEGLSGHARAAEGRALGARRREEGLQTGKGGGR